MSPIITFLNKQGYTSFKGLVRRFEIPPKSMNSFRAELDMACNELHPQLGQVRDDDASRAILEPNVYYSIQWLRGKELHFRESIGDLIGYDLYQRIIKNGWNSYNGQPGLLNFQALSNASLEFVMRYVWTPPRQYAWATFEQRYRYWNPAARGLYLQGLEFEHAGNTDSAMGFYKQAEGYPQAQYRIARLIKLAIGDNYQSNPTQTQRILDLLKASKNKYLPAAYLLGEMYRGIGNNQQAMYFYQQANQVQGWNDLDDETAICLAKMYYYGQGKPQNQSHAFYYCQMAKDNGSHEAGALLAQWRQDDGMEQV